MLGSETWNFKVSAKVIVVRSKHAEYETGNVRINVTLRSVRATTVAVEKRKSITRPVCVYL